MTCFNTASGMDCMQCFRASFRCTRRSSFNTASGMDCMQLGFRTLSQSKYMVVSIPQAVWIACNSQIMRCLGRIIFGFNTASGMDCMQLKTGSDLSRKWSFNTASGMDCMQLVLSDMSNYTKKSVSIPQAVWIACNFIRRMECARLTRFQYRKRYGLHAMTTPKWRMTTISKFQYRKRYGLHAIEARLTLESLSIGFNTASGMDCMQFPSLLVIWKVISCFNTASGMDCMQ